MNILCTILISILISELSSFHSLLYLYWAFILKLQTFLVAQMIKNPPAMQVDLSSIPGPGRSPGKGNGNPLQYSGLENPMDKGAWWATVHGVLRSWTQLRD